MKEILTVDFDGLKKDHWSDTEQSNVKLVAGFIQSLMNNHDFERVLEVYNNSKYLQHNRAIPEGVEGVVNYVKGFVKKFPDYTYDVKHMYADGDIVIFHSQITINAKHRGKDNKGINVTDTWRIENNEIVEHWDSLQPIDFVSRLLILFTGGSVKNKNGVY